MLRRFVKSVFHRAGINVSSRATLGHDLEGDMLRLGHPGSIVFDVGANVGQSIRIFKTLFPDSQIHAFEPDARAYGEAVKVAGAYRNVTVLNYALGADEAVGDFREYTASAMSSFLEPSGANWSKPARVRPVRVSTIDGYCTDHQIDRIDILKVDVQGRDLSVLRGAKAMLAGNVTLVRTELNFMTLYTGQDDPLDTLRFMRELGYDLIAFYEQHLRGGRLGWADVLFRPG
jgi:FkbM family methyltransferase